MANSENEFQHLMQQVVAGSDDAATKLFRHYEPVLLQAIRRRLNKKIRSKFDSMDFAQDVWASFFADEPGKREFRTSEDLLKFLTRLAQNKVADKSRQRLKLQKHNVDRELSIDDSRRFDRDHLTGDQPTPSHIVMSKEEWTNFLRKQPLVHRRIFVMLREGKTHNEIATELGISSRHVRRVADQYAPGLKT